MRAFLQVAGRIGDDVQEGERKHAGRNIGRPLRLRQHDPFDHRALAGFAAAREARDQRMRIDQRSQILGLPLDPGPPRL